MELRFGKILVFGGTTEGRTAAERLTAEGIPCTVSVATRYGEEVLSPHPLMSVHRGRLDHEEMARLMQEEEVCCVIDATHPHALAVSGEIREACRETGLPYLRLQRQETGRDGRSVSVRDAEEAGVFLSSVPGGILVTTGSKELGCFARALGDPSRIYARVLPSQESLRACKEAGLSGKQIFAMQGPFDTDMNCALIRHTGASWLLTKETGTAGGFPQKMEAAEKCGIGTVVIRAEASPGMNTEEAVAAARRYAEAAGKREGAAEKRILSLVGIGPGAPEKATPEAEKVVTEAEVLFGAGSVLGTAARIWKAAEGKSSVPVYDGAEILEYLRLHPEIRRAAVVFSGDSGFYSGASSVLEKIRDREDLEVRTVCGISSVSCFAARAGIPWQDWKILSSHGRKCNVVGQVRRHRKCFLLLSGAADLRRTGADLAEAEDRGVLREEHGESYERI